MANIYGIRKGEGFDHDICGLSGKFTDTFANKNEQPHEKTNNVVSEHDGHKPSCTSAEDG